LEGIKTMDRRVGSREIKDIQAAQAKLEQMQLEAQVAQFVRSNPGASFEDALRALKAQEYDIDLMRRDASEQAAANRIDQENQVRDLAQGLETVTGQNEIYAAQLSDAQKKNIALIANAERTPNISQKRRAGELVAAILAGAGILELVDPDPELEQERY
jgi:hypothetical protein